MEQSSPSPKKRRYGPTPKASSDRRWHSVSCRLTDDELALVDARRGKVRRGEWLRLSALGKPPRIVPELNRVAWVDLARSASNLNQIAHAVNCGEVPAGGDLASVLDALRADLDALRLAMIGGGDEGEG
ncbi:MobC domain-containing protein [Komagataeibacter medellinensis]|uniref:plasmid mobilization relaxosome protein MobC n=1 Tax=Komagataeibacter medellinensis TaxID=1177712 RepID=UPI0011D198D5|nr:plasmid mobilization relaxosome protein MobC [Komagataeibacter medellinensis]